LVIDYLRDMDQVQEIKDKVDIVEIISGYLTLKRAGKNYKGVCPFHSEKTPSFMVAPERQTFRCFGCNEGGDVFTFIEKIEGLDFYNAMKLLADKAGVKLEERSVRRGEQDHQADTKTRLFEINELTKRLYEKVLQHPKAERARKYLANRGLSDKTLEQFEIGYAPVSWDFLTKFLKSKGFSEVEIVEAGVAIKSDNGRVYDRFRGRIMFPINNIMGSTIAFTSRILEDDGKSAKYINSAESSIYSKGKTIYGLDKAKGVIRSKNQVVMVEGQMDVIACHQAGFSNVVATSGTALTFDQLKILSRYSQEIVFCFDSDNAGQVAMKRAIRIALQNDIAVKIISIPKPYKDPDEAIKKDPKIWEDSVGKARPALEYWIDSMLDSFKELGISEKKQVAREILPVIKIIESSIEKEHYIKYLSEKLDVSQESLSQAVEKTKGDTEFVESKKLFSPNPKEVILTLPERLLIMLWGKPELLELKTVEYDKLPVLGEKFLVLKEMAVKGSITRDKVSDSIASELDQEVLGIFQDLGESEDAIKEEFLFLSGRWRSEQKEAIKESFAQQIRDAEQSGDNAKLALLLKEFSSLLK